jgi:hypothetical protein
MAVRRNKLAKDTSDSNYEKIKEEVIILLTGQDPKSKENFDYIKLLKRVTVILVATYGISRVSILRQIALSIVTTLVTRWLAQQALDNTVAISA